MDKRKQLWKVGLVVFILGGFTNTVFMKMGVSGLLREGSRLAVFLGLGLLIYGVIRKR